MGMQRVQAASSAACRVGTLPAGDVAAQQAAMQNAAAKALATTSLVQAFQLQSQLGSSTGDPVVVEVRVPMTAAAPDLLRVLGFSLQGRQLSGADADVQTMT